MVNSAKTMGETLLGGVFNLHETKHEPSQQVLNDLRELVRRCQTKYGGKKELATDRDDLIRALCNGWEKVLAHGLKTPYTSVLKNVQDIVAGNNNEAPSFWLFSQSHLTTHERERFEKLQHVWTNRGKTKALIRSALNERSLERYILMWLSDPNLKELYEPWACLRDAETVNLLPSMAAGLSSILFAITIDTPIINGSKTDSRKTEPVIYAPQAVGPSKKSVVVKRQIVSFDSKPLDEPTSSSSSSKPEFIDNSPISTIYSQENFVVEPIDVMSYMTNHIDIFPDDIEAVLSEDEALTKCSPSVSNLTVEASTSSCQSEDRSSVISSTASLASKSDVAVLEEKFNEISERCRFLEGRVAELSLENCNLRRLVNMNKEALEFIVSIPRVVLLRSGPRKYYAYQIHVNSTNGLDEWTTLKRYSEFYKLHQQLQKINPAVKVLDFPPKKTIGNMDISFVEDRRQRLQVYLRHLLASLPEIASCTTRNQLQTTFPFLR